MDATPGIQGISHPDIPLPGLGGAGRVPCVFKATPGTHLRPLTAGSC